MLKPRTARPSSPVPPVAFEDCPAKTFATADGRTVAGRSVPVHCQIVGEVARALVAHYPQALRTALFPEGAPMAAALHDIGKVSPTFYEKIRQACTDGTGGWPVLAMNPSLEKLWGGHAGVSQVAVEAMGAPPWISTIVGQHHGFTPVVGGRQADAEDFGGAAWQAQRQALVQFLKQQLQLDWPQVQSAAQARLLSGLTTVADWIGSGRFFEDPADEWRPKIQQALVDAGYLRPRIRQGLGFDQVFGFPPRKAQLQWMAAVNGPGVYVLEAPMGMGKTEAALYAAYQMLAQERATGIYFALPTQLTSNKIHARFQQFLERILEDDARHRPLLLHANAWLTATEMGEEGRPGGAWFNQAKRGLLAPFAVGTVDQALMAAMNVKHGFVRAFGLAGKVVILDEVHSYDVYTGTLLDALIQLLTDLQCTVIVLSATLSQARRHQLLKADLHSNAYPLITALPASQAVIELPVEADGATRVKIHLQSNASRAVQEALDRAASGQQVLWIENTVKDAQQRYLDLASRAAELGLSCGLLHSRFTMADRAKAEGHWVDLFGKAGWDRRGASGRILVGTQVLEQSLDIDADFLVSRFAPTDMLLQRLGRLWRHGQTPRSSTASCEAWWLAPDLATAIAQPLQAFASTAHVYNPYVLCRSLEVWQACGQLDLPTDIRGLIEATYAQRPEVGPMARWLFELEEGIPPHRLGRKSLQQLARIGLSEAGKTLPESKAQTRYSESDAFDVLLLRQVHLIGDRQLTQIQLLDGQTLELPWHRHKLSKQAWKQLTASLMHHVVPTRPSEAPVATPRHVLEKFGLHHCFYLGDPNWADDESLLRIAVVDERAKLHGMHGGRAHDKHTLEYRHDLGYRVIKD